MSLLALDRLSVGHRNPRRKSEPVHGALGYLKGLFDTCVYPLKSELKCLFLDARGSLRGKSNSNWKKWGTLVADGVIRQKRHTARHSFRSAGSNRQAGRASSVYTGLWRAGARPWRGTILWK
ncbi:gp34 [Anopheles sinensis]|uniref:Gp34 n=1 Tax=Anopheles sinensis TaxID=74873 RepID=A0A084VDW3_ANOSI|nr:gp34 [Anopheles sinensis]